MRRSLLATALLVGFLPALSQAAPNSVDGTPWDDATRLQLRGRLIDVVPQTSSSTNIGGHVNAGSALAPEADLSYFFSDYISAEAIAATTQHKLTHNSAGDLGTTWILPPTVTLQYHPMPHEQFSPYFGAGFNYSYFYDEQSAKGNGINDMKINGGVGYALQAGADYWIDNHWGVNVDVKKLFLNVDAKLNGGAVRANVDLDPWIVGTGVTYHF